MPLESLYLGHLGVSFGHPHRWIYGDALSDLRHSPRSFPLKVLKKTLYENGHFVLVSVFFSKLFHYKLFVFFGEKTKNTNIPKFHGSNVMQTGVTLISKDN